MITIAEDSIFEGREYFRLRINAVRPIGQAAQFFIPQDGANNTFVDISIEDDDSKLSSSSYAIKTQNYHECMLGLSHIITSHQCFMYSYE